MTSIDFKYDEMKRLILIFDKRAKIFIDLSNHFPFEAPIIRMELKDKESQMSLFDFNNLKFEDIMKEHWHPSIKISDIAENVVDFIDRHSAPYRSIPAGVPKYIHHTFGEKKKKMWMITFMVKITLCFLLTTYEAYVGI